ncbi:5'-nucleotidase [uncultured Winogradskyella sp.]|uniref:5'-nucleotidase C-terminal domain-containing protein n=1 Tax=uncultured Winogradskyella sp. TaxID=395353 RepID=UPI002617404A|nr:5'-nucleotidase [uncultured Winogradskyella sp.]
MHIKYIFKLLFLVFIVSCNKTHKLTKIKAERLEINETLSKNATVENFIKPYRANVNKNLDSIISFALDTYSKTDGDYNTAIGNLMADAVFTESDPIFYLRTGQHLDFALLNHGGIRAPISKGAIRIRTAFEIMPFENSVVIVALKGEQIIKMTEYLSQYGKAHPISNQFQLILNADSTIYSATVNGNNIDESKIYYVATNDYLYNGGNQMTFFHPNDGLYVLDYKIRNVLIDYFKKNDTINPKRDNRFIMKTK